MTILSEDYPLAMLYYRLTSSIYREKAVMALMNPDLVCREEKLASLTVLNKNRRFHRSNEDL